MKKYLVISAMCAAAALLSGCMGGPIANHNGFATAPAGFIISDMKGGLMVQERHPGRRYKVIGKVQAEAMTTCYLFLVSIGDASYQSLKKEALSKYPGKADDIIDIELDFRHDNLLSLINKVYVRMDGTAIKYLDTPEEK